MARIRTIKPEFWSDERLSALPESVHILAAALLNYADDHGYFNANPKLIKAACFPLREPSVSVEDGIMQLVHIGYLQLADGTDGRRYGWVVNFAKHQRVNRPSESRISTLATFTEGSVNAHGGLTEGSLLEQGTGNREKEQGRERKAAADADLALPERLDVPDFRDAWQKWVKHRSEIRKPLKPTMIAEQLDQFAQWGPERAIAAIKHTIGKGWQGIREPDAQPPPFALSPATRTIPSISGVRNDAS